MTVDFQKQKNDRENCRILDELKRNQGEFEISDWSKKCGKDRRY